MSKSSKLSAYELMAIALAKNEGYQVWNDNLELSTKKLLDLIANNQNIECGQLINDKDKQELDRYYRANNLLVECLKITQQCRSVSDNVRQEIEETLLLPIAAIEEYQQQINP